MSLNTGRAEDSQAEWSINFVNLGTVEMCVHELSLNLEQLYRQRAEAEQRYLEAEAEWNAVNTDLTHRLRIIEAGLERYNESIPQPEPPVMRPTGQPQAERMRH